DQDMTPVYLVAGLMMVASAAPTATIIPLIRLEDWWIYLIYSIAVNAFVLVIIAMRYLPAPEVSLFILLETILGPLWVWIVLAEVPRAETVAGGMLILGVLICYFSYAIYRHRRAIRQSPARTYQH
ncbi:MAG: EamA family transporter, partial [Pseudomonadota bacterium]